MTNTQWRKRIAFHVSSARRAAKAAAKEEQRGRGRHTISARWLRASAAQHAVTAAVMAALVAGQEKRAAKLAQAAVWACAQAPDGRAGVRFMLQLQGHMVLLAAGLR